MTAGDKLWMLEFFLFKFLATKLMQLSAKTLQCAVVLFNINDCTLNIKNNMITRVLERLKYFLKTHFITANNKKQDMGVGLKVIRFIVIKKVSSASHFSQSPFHYNYKNFTVRTKYI